MLKQNKLLAALVFTCLVITTIVTLNYSATTFDKSDYISELTSEEKAAIEQERIETDYATYQEQIEARPEYVNFAGFDFYNDEASYDAFLTTTVDTMNKSTDYSEEQKNDYYNAVIGTDIAPGLYPQMRNLSLILMDYSEQENVVVDCTEALALLATYESPDPSIDNLEFIANMSSLLNQIPSTLKPVSVNSLSPEELDAAQQSNIVFTNGLKAIYAQAKDYTLPKTPLWKRITHTPVLLNTGLLVAIIVLFVVRFPLIKKQQEYAWNEFKPLSLLVIPIVGLVAFIFFSWFFNPEYPVDDVLYTIYDDGVAMAPSDRIYLNEIGKHNITLVAAGLDNTVSAVDFDVIVTDDPNISASKGEMDSWTYGDLGLMKFSTEMGKNQVVFQYVDDQFAFKKYSEAITDLGLIAEDRYEPDETMSKYYLQHYRNEFILPMKLRLVIPSLFFGTLYFMFMLMPKPMVRTYLNELYTINKFCGFLSYNMAYRSNARVLIEETLQSLDSCKFAEDFAIIFFEKERNMTDKIQDISQIYSYKFFEMYLGIVNIIFDEGVSDSTLKSLTIIQQFGDEYYNQADMFFKSKNGAISSLLMIIAICVVIPVVVKTKGGDMFAVYLCSANGYTGTVVCYIIWFGLVCVIFDMFKNNKIVRKEGRYA